MTEEMDINEALGLTPGKNRWKRYAYWIVLLALITSAFMGLWGYWQKSVAAKAVVHYRTEAAQTGDLTVTVTATGQLKPTRTVDVGSQVSGIVDTVLATYNQSVKKGDVLARINTDKLEAQVSQDRAQLQSAHAQVDNAKVTVWETQAEYSRYADARQRSKSQIVSQHDVDTAKAASDRAVVAVTTAEAAVTQAEANLKIDETNLGFAVITSPVDGIVLSRSVEPGQTIAASFQVATLFEIAEDLRKMTLEVNVDEADVGHVKEGQPVSFTVDAYPGRKFPGTITQVRYNSTTTNNVVTYQAEISVDNSQMLLRSGMTATASITVLSAKNVLMVPNLALRFLPTETAGASGGGLLSRMLPTPPGQSGSKNSDSSAAMNNPTVWVTRDNNPYPIPVVLVATNGKFTEVKPGALASGTPLIVETLKATK